MLEDLEDSSPLLSAAEEYIVFLLLLGWFLFFLIYGQFGIDLIEKEVFVPTYPVTFIAYNGYLAFPMGAVCTIKSFKVLGEYDLSLW